MGLARLAQLRWALALLLCAVVVPGRADFRGANHEEPVGPKLTVSAFAGFPGGSMKPLMCPDDKPYLVGVDGRFGQWIDALAPMCVGFNSSGRWDVPEAVTPPGTSTGGSGGGSARVACPMGSYMLGMVGVTQNLFGDSVDQWWKHLIRLDLQCGSLERGIGDTFSTPFARQDECDDCLDIYDKVQMTCGPGQIARGLQAFSGKYIDSVALVCGPPPVAAVALGRVMPRGTTEDTRSLCEAASDARARNSPAAPGLERQCAASKPPPLALGRVQSTEMAIDGSAEAPKSLCDAARSARARNSPAAPGLERQCLATGGVLVASAPVDAERVENLAEIGKQIARSDPAVAAARRNPDIEYRQGFDIATGLFGDPALGAAGNTLMGPGSQAIRDSLGSAGRDGFNASVSFHQARQYRH